MWETFDQSLARYRDLEQQLADPVVIADRGRYAALAKEHGALARRVKPYQEYLDVAENLKQADALVAAETDTEMRRYVEEERDQLRARQQGLTQRLEDLMLEGPGEDF